MIFLILIIIYVTVLCYYYSKYSFKIFGDPIFWLLFSTLYYLLLSNYSLFKLNPLDLDVNVKVSVDYVVILVSCAILISSMFFLVVFKVDYNVKFNFEVSKLSYQLSKFLFLICFFYFLIVYAIYFPKALGLSIAERRVVFDKVLHLKYWFFNGIFLLSTTIIFIKSTSRYRVLLLVFSYLFLISFPLYVSYRVVAIKSIIFLIIFLSIYFDKEYKYMIRRLLLISLIVLTLVIPLTRMDFNQIDLDIVRLLFAPIGESLFTRQSIDIAYANMFHKSDMLYFMQNFILFSLPGFLRPMEVDNIDKILTQYYYYGEDLGLAGSVLNEGIYYGGYVGIIFATFAITAFVFLARFFVYKLNSFMFFFVGIYAAANIINLFRNGVSQTMLIYSTSILFSFWVFGKISRYKQVS